MNYNWPGSSQTIKLSQPTFKYFLKINLLVNKQSLSFDELLKDQAHRHKRGFAKNLRWMNMTATVKQDLRTVKKCCTEGNQNFLTMVIIFHHALEMQRIPFLKVIFWHTFNPQDTKISYPTSLDPINILVLML